MKNDEDFSIKPKSEQISFYIKILNDIFVSNHLPWQKYLKIIRVLQMQMNFW